MGGWWRNCGGEAVTGPRSAGSLGFSIKKWWMVYGAGWRAAQGWIYREAAEVAKGRGEGAGEGLLIE